MAEKKDASDDAWEKLKGLPITGQPCSLPGHTNSGWGWRWELFSRPGPTPGSQARPPNSHPGHTDTGCQWGCSPDQGSSLPHVLAGAAELQEAVLAPLPSPDVLGPRPTQLTPTST